MSSESGYVQAIIGKCVDCFDDIHRQIAAGADNYIMDLILCDFKLFHDIADNLWK